MNKAFLKNENLCDCIGCVGGIAVAILLFTSVLIAMPSRYGSTDWGFSWIGLASVITKALTVAAGYFVLRGIALIGLRAYENETNARVEPTFSEAPTGIGNTKIAMEKQKEQEQDAILQKAKDKRQLIIIAASLIIAVIVAIIMKYSM